MKNILRSLFSLMLALLLSISTCHVAFSTGISRSDNKVIRVAWFDFDGFQMTDEDGYRSGYAYDYLQEIARHTGWRYEYVHGTVPECLDMMKNHEIDLMALVMYSDERESYMQFSNLSMGRNYSLITTLSGNSKYNVGEYRGMDGIHIGYLAGDLRRFELGKLAAEKGFSYYTTEYDTTREVEQALQNGEVEAILTTSMRVPSPNEKVIAQFAPADFFFVTPEGDTKIINTLNSAMEQIEFTRKGFQSELSQKYFSVKTGGTLAFTKSELAYIKENPIVPVALPAPSKPLYSLDGGAYNGLVVDIMDAMARKIGISFEYHSTNLHTEALEDILNNKAHIIANAYNDYSWSEKNHMFLTISYLNLDYVMVGRGENYYPGSTIKVAAVRDYPFSRHYVESRYSDDQIVWLENESACVEAVYTSRADICYINSYTAANSLSGYRYRNLQSSKINFSHGVSMGVSNQNVLLLSILDKTIASMGEDEINSLIDKNITHAVRTPSFFELVIQYPLQFASIWALLIVGIFGLVAATVIYSNNHRKNQEVLWARFEAEHDSLTGLYNRPAFEAIVNNELQKQQNPTGAFVMLDIDKFKTINDTQGHRYGDRVLAALGNGLQNFFALQNAFLCRMGGDELAMFFPSISGDELHLLITECQQKLAAGYADEIPIRCSFGVAMVTEQRCDFSMLYEDADKALYAAKRSGGGCVNIYTE